MKTHNHQQIRAFTRRSWQRYCYDFGVLTASDCMPASLEEAVALLGQFREQWSSEKRLLELRIKDLEHRLFGSSSEKLPIEDRQLALIDEVFDHALLRRR
jgi:hypothetical protein